MTTQNKAVTCYLPKDIEDFITGYCNEYGITRKDKEGETLPSLGTGIIELLKLLAYNPELVSSPILDTVPSKFSEDAIEKKIDEILEKKLSNHLPDNVPSIEVVKDRLDNWVLAVDGDIKDINQKIRDRSLQVDHQIASIKSRLDNMERLLRLQQSASIASPIPTGEPSPLPPSPDEPVRPAIETVTPEVSPSPPGTDAIASIDGTGTGAIGPFTDDTLGTGTETEISDSRTSATKEKGLTDSELARHLGIDKSNITRWKQRGKPTPKYKDWELIGRLWYKKSERKD
jgi:hypothetical protein